jgi:hypothetical protein
MPPYGNPDYRYPIKELRSANQNIYVDSVAGLNTHNGTSWADAIKDASLAFDAVPCNAKFSTYIYLSGNNHLFPNRITQKDCVLGGAMNYVIGVHNEGTTYKLGTIITLARPQGFVIRVLNTDGSTPTFVDNALIGQKIKWKTGLFTGSYAWVYKNDDTNRVYLSIGKWDWIHNLPLVNDQFCFDGEDTVVSTSGGAGAGGIDLMLDNDSFQFEHIKFDMAGRIAVRRGTHYFQRCKLYIECLSILHSQLTDLYTTFHKPRTTSEFMIAAAESATLKFRRGTVLDGENRTNSCMFLRNGINLRLEEQTVFSRLVNGVRAAGIHVQDDNATDSFWTFNDCGDGWKNNWYVDTTGILTINQQAPNTGVLPMCYGTISATYFINEKAGSNLMLTAGSDVSNGVMKNPCSVDGGLSAGCINHKDGTVVRGEVLQKRTLADGATTFSAIGYDYVETVANTAPTALASVSNGTVGQKIVLKGGSNTNSTTIAHGGVFSLAGGIAWTASLGARIELQCIDGTNWEENWRRAP